MKSLQTFSEDNIIENVDQVENSVEPSNSEECDIRMFEEKMAKLEENSAVNIQEKVSINRTKDVLQLQTLHTHDDNTGESILGRRNILLKKPANKLVINEEKLDENAFEETLGRGRIEDELKQDENCDRNSPECIKSDVHDDDNYDYGDGDNDENGDNNVDSGDDNDDGDNNVNSGDDNDDGDGTETGKFRNNS